MAFASQTKSYGTKREKSSENVHISRKIKVALISGRAVIYECPMKHRGLPEERFITGSRKEIRAHYMQHHING